MWVGHPLTNNFQKDLSFQVCKSLSVFVSGSLAVPWNHVVVQHYGCCDKDGCMFMTGWVDGHMCYWSYNGGWRRFAAMCCCTFLANRITTYSVPLVIFVRRCDTYMCTYFFASSFPPLSLSIVLTLLCWRIIFTSFRRASKNYPTKG